MPHDNCHHADVASLHAWDAIRGGACAAQSGGTADVAKLAQSFRDLSHYAPHHRVRGLFYSREPLVSTVLEMSRFLRGDALPLEEEAGAHRPLPCWSTRGSALFATGNNAEH